MNEPRAFIFEMTGCLENGQPRKSGTVIRFAVHATVDSGELPMRSLLTTAVALADELAEKNLVTSYRFAGPVDILPASEPVSLRK